MKYYITINDIFQDILSMLKKQNIEIPRLHIYLVPLHILSNLKDKDSFTFPYKGISTANNYRAIAG